jgi:amidohydrolase
MKMELLPLIKQLSEELHEQVVGIRRTIHENPELSYQEFKTSKLIFEELKKLGLEVQNNVAKTGVVGILKCQNPNSFCLALRADMDALPIQEQNDLSFKSKENGVMHACGHDVHSASLLGVAMILSNLKDSLRGTYKFIFQPSEEKMPSGANAMITEGVLLNPSVDAIFGFHVHPEMEVGEVGFKSGQFMASADEIYITVRGKGGHAAQPSQFISPLVMASEVVLSLKEVTEIEKPIVLTFGKMVANGATNIVPDEAKLEGTLRCFDENYRNATHDFILLKCREIAEKYHADIDVNIVNGYPVLSNNEELTDHSFYLAEQYLETGNCHRLPIRMGAEDFAFYSQKIPACFYRVGVGNKANGITHPIHSPFFKIDENALKISVALMSWLAVNFKKQDLSN